MTNYTYCDLKTFSKRYEGLHGPLSFLVCVFGSIANILNICVLTSKDMRWPTNLILTGLAVSDLLVMLDYIPFTMHRYLNTEGKKYVDSYNYNWAVFMYFHAIFSQVFHFISCCLTIILAVWRYVIITNPHNSNKWCGMRRTLLVIILTYALCPLICSPLFVSLTISSHNQSCDLSGKIISKKDLANYTGLTQNRSIFVLKYITETHRHTSFLIYGVVIKLVPCVLLTHLSQRLISVLLETKRRRKLLLNGNLPLKSMNSTVVPLNRHFERVKQADRTSGMLVAVLLLFLITEFPQAILGLLSVTKGKLFEKECYVPLGDVMDILALTNSAINFILYCTMSRQFRTTFQEVFRPRIFNHWISLSQYSAVEKVEKTQISQV